MTKRLALILALALVVAGCGPEDEGSGTTASAVDDTTTTSVVETTTSTTPPPEHVYSVCDFEMLIDTDASPLLLPNPGDVCVNLDQEFTSEEADSLDVGPDLGTYLGAGQDFCLVFEDHVFVWRPGEHPDGLIPEDLGLEPLIDGTLIDSETPETVQPALDHFANDDSPVGLYLNESGSPLFDILGQLGDAGFVASPHYVLMPTPIWTYGPHDAPSPIQGVNWEGLRKGSHEGGVVTIVDTGPTTDVGQNGSPAIEQPIGTPQTPDEYTAHGTFAASIALQFNRNLRVLSVPAADSDGILSEASVTTAILDAPGVVNLSLGTYSCGPQYPTLGLIATMIGMPGTQFVAAAGNDGFDLATMFPAVVGFPNYAAELAEAYCPFGPTQETSTTTLPGTQCIDAAQDAYSIAADDVALLADRVTAVGALDATLGSIAGFSNRGEVYVPGTNMIGFYNGGLARWSGTSFATPYFAACLASFVCDTP